MGIFSKLFSRKNAVMDPVRQVSKKQYNDIILAGIEVFPSDEQVVLLLAGDYLESYHRGQSFETGFDSYIRFATIQLAGEGAPAELIEVARKIRALHDLRALQGKVYEAALFDLEFLESDKDFIFSLEDGVLLNYKTNASQAGKLTYQYLNFASKSEAAVNEKVAKVKELHLQRAAEARERALATIAELNL